MGLVLQRVEIAGVICDIRMDAGTVTEIAPRLRTTTHDEVIDGAGGALIPGLHDHHVHLLALAAQRGSVICGPPGVSNAAQLRSSLKSAAAAVTPGGWVRGVSYHESISGLPDHRRLDQWCPDVPLRIQHRSGALWMLNQIAIDRLGLANVESESIERDEVGRPTGRLWRGDVLLHALLRQDPPPLAPVGLELAAVGVTSVTDATVSNDPSSLARLAAAKSAGLLPQHLRVMGPLGITACNVEPAIVIGEVKFVLDDQDLPMPDDLAQNVRTVHRTGRAAAFHCVTHTQLVVVLAALRAAGSFRDRIEHASVAHPSSIGEMRDLNVAVVTQPGFISERGDEYLDDVDASDQPSLYPIGSLRRAGVSVGGSTDAPFTAPNPWLGMHAAVTRQSASGQPVLPSERIDPEDALDLFLGDPDDVRAPPRRVGVGSPADLVLLGRPWREARSCLDATDVAVTVIDGVVVHGG